MVFRKNYSDAQIEDEIAYVENFGWAPQRVSSRARPDGRSCRRWDIIFRAVSAEATGKDPKRRVLARMYLSELGGANSSRLVLAGFLADLTAEHYTWVAGADKRNPDATTAQTRAECFLARIRALFTDGLVLTMPDTFTGATLKFLEKTTYYKHGDGVQSIGIGDWENDPHARQLIQTALGRVKVVVANIEEYMELYRSKNSWIHAFTAFRLPSPLSVAGSVSDGAGRTALADVKASLTRICEAAGLSVRTASPELMRLLPRAEKFRAAGCCPRVAWGRAAAEWPELKQARSLVEIFIVWKTGAGNIERRFRRLRAIRCPERGKMVGQLCQIACE